MVLYELYVTDEVPLLCVHARERERHNRVCFERTYTLFVDGTLNRMLQHRNHDRCDRVYVLDRACVAEVSHCPLESITFEEYFYKLFSRRDIT
jgi:hypothetical protein